jgi:transcription elongation factor Elf1
MIAAAAKISLCPKCGSREGFWLGVKRSHAYVQCKSCGASFELYEVFALNGKNEPSKRLKIFRK